MAQIEVLEKAGKLLALAQSDNNEDEARNAAVALTHLMKEHKLVLIPQTEIDRVKTVIGDAQSLARRYEGEAQQKMLIGAFAGFMLGSKGKLL